MATKKKVSGDERKAKLLEVGGKLAGKYGAKNVTRRMVAQGGKVSEALVSAYFGTRDELQRTMKRQAKKMGLVEPSAEKVEEIGRKLRAHKPGDKRDARPRKVEEWKAIINNKAAGKVVRKPAERKVIEDAPSVVERRTPSAARLPMLPPVQGEPSAALPPLPVRTL